MGAAGVPTQYNWYLMAMVAAYASSGSGTREYWLSQCSPMNRGECVYLRSIWRGRRCNRIRPTPRPAASAARAGELVLVTSRPDQLGKSSGWLPVTHVQVPVPMVSRRPVHLPPGDQPQNEVRPEVTNVETIARNPGITSPRCDVPGLYGCRRSSQRLVHVHPRTRMGLPKDVDTSRERHSVVGKVVHDRAQ